jgi:hypothetical protein
MDTNMNNIKSPHLRALIRMVLYATVIGAVLSGIGMSLNYIYITFGTAGIVKTVAAIGCVVTGGTWYSILLEEERNRNHEG